MFIVRGRTEFAVINGIKTQSVLYCSIIQKENVIDCGINTKRKLFLYRVTIGCPSITVHLIFCSNSCKDFGFVFTAVVTFS